ncbi:Malate/lactate/ureidoglycolate dehydrogenase, LDH2 family [Paracoccus alcaliphilus]|uniref:Malate/lactate/ureidoglycolate dehydrogenase, LDH2 family n=2 Tax=Paracoccus alcaliphilus TaxID=34002 RepID=A0A1H8JW97_9RHOB|nr:Ldh family oxidoreductase [Paracoccus alcaliphilus]WCR20538.1 Ldh family oxidoreductase [Paracoccus alcaliphilus]SEN84993.1 Malate/lactate/ureidoglycolate dehydrogenase, LDH2 family [Paracoccus alcaliphilus]
MSSTTIPFETLSQRIEQIFLNVGACPAQAGAVARVIAKGERDDCKSHGVYRIAGLLRTIRAGKVDATSDPVLDDAGGGVIRVDAQGGFSPAAFELGAPVLAERARDLGVAALVINDCTHFSALWPEIEALTDMGLAGLAMCPSYAVVAPAGGTAPLLGTNPIAFGWPRPDRDPFVFDIATSVAARGEIELHRQQGKPLPQGWALDAEGQPTTDPEAALDGAMLPFGAHKGSAIAIMIELLAGSMIGDRTSREALDYLGSTTILPNHGELILAFAPERFSAGGAAAAMASAETLLGGIEDQGARLPSQRRFAARARAQAGGIPLSDAEWADLDRLRDVGLDAV